jgi:glycyl-tRNA synthetase beta chain
LEIPGLDPDPLRLTAEAVLRPEFLLVANGLEQASALITRGNERVLGARLADAEFFLEVDRRQASATRRDALSRVTFAEGLGSLRDRCDRIERLTNQLLTDLVLSDSVATASRRAAHLCKHDLVSQMVGEFPELQGLMGGKYLLEEGESRDVALAVVEHYLPRGAGDELPSTDAGAVVALAERFELLLSIFAKGERPTGSSDPYALRRAGNGVLLILWNQGWKLDLNVFLAKAVEAWRELFPAFAVDTAQLTSDLSALLRQRITSQLEDDGYAADLVQAVAGDTVSTTRLLHDPLDVRVRIQLLRGLRDQGRLTAVQAVVQRASRLAEKGDLPLDVLSSTEVVDPSRFESASEKGLFDATERLNPLAERGAYQELCDVLVESTPALEAFFDGDQSVMVMADDPALRMNRLNLLGVLRNQAAVFAQFELIQS